VKAGQLTHETKIQLTFPAKGGRDNRPHQDGYPRGSGPDAGLVVLLAVIVVVGGGGALLALRVRGGLREGIHRAKCLKWDRQRSDGLTPNPKT